MADIYLGVTHTPEYVFDGVPFLSVKDISGGKICFDDCKYISQEEYDSLSEGAKPKVGDMLFCRVGTLGKPIIIPEGTPLFGSFVSLGYLRNKNAHRCDLNYLRYWMNSNSFWKQVNSNVKGASQVNLNTGWLSKFDIDLPEMQEQKYRISVLDKCKVIIERREEELKVLDDLIKARFVELFGDVKTNSFTWEKCAFADVTTKITDGEHGTVPRVEEGEGYLYFMARNITKEGLINLSETSYVPEEVHQKIYKRCNPEIDDILLVCVGATIGKCALVTEELGEFSMARSVALLKPDTQKVNSIFLINLLKSDAIQNDISNCAHAAAQAGLYTNMIKSLDAFLPPIELQNQFADFVKKIDKSKVAIQKSLDETQQLFDSLMQEYFG